MLQSLILTSLFAILSSGIFAQSFDELVENENYSALIEYADKTDDLTGNQLYYLGFAHFQSDDDKTAIKMYDLALKKGYDSYELFFFQGLSYRLLEKWEASRSSFRKALSYERNHQTTYTELANTFYFQEKMDSALFYFKKARSLEFVTGEPYFMVAHVYHLQGEYDTALLEYYAGLEIEEMDLSGRTQLLNKIGLLEFTHTENYTKSAAAYEASIALDATQYELYTKLSKAYYASGETEKAENLFSQLKEQYTAKTLPESMMDVAGLIIAEFKWNEQSVLIFKTFEDASETLDMLYKIYLLSPDGSEIERRLMTERTIKLSEDSPEHLLCEREANGTHHTYLYGWTSDAIPFESLKEAVIAVFNKELKPGASSSLGSTDKKNKKKKR